MRGYMSAVLLATVMAGSGSLAGPVSAAEFRLNSGAWVDLAMSVNGYFPVIGQAMQQIAGPSQVSYGGRLTFLLVGSDSRGGGGERLDAIAIMSINPSNKNISGVSIPRDTGRIQIPSQYGGGLYNGKINGMFGYFKSQTGGSRAQGLERFKVTVEQLLQINIDYVVYMRFNGFDALVDEVGGVNANIPNEIRDPKYIDKPDWPKGAKFLADTSALLKGGSAPRCYGGYPKPVTNWGPVLNCTRAMVYVRTRKGTIGNSANNDYKRAGRQQKFTVEAIKRLTSLGLSKAYAVRTKANSMPSDFYTDMPTSNGDVQQLFNLLSGSAFTQTAVLSPPTYATRVSGTSKNQLKLDVVRNLCDNYFDSV